MASAASKPRSERRTVHRVCPFCEATCGLAVEVEGDSIVTVRGDEDDPFSRGFICPKAYGLLQLHHDPERLRRPVRRTADGWEEIGWDEARSAAPQTPNSSSVPSPGSSSWSRSISASTRRRATRT